MAAPVTGNFAARHRRVTMLLVAIGSCAVGTVGFLASVAAPW